MTGSAIIGQCALMKINMAGEAPLLQPQKGIFTPRDLFVFNIFGLMALGAFDGVVLPFKLIAGQLVVEAILIEGRTFEVCTVMIAMAIGAFPRLHRIGKMKAPGLINQGLNFLVAFQTLGTGYGFSQHVTLRAIRNPFQITVLLDQWAGCDLSLADQRQLRYAQHNNMVPECAHLYFFIM
jgi:hypothetical protein